MNNPKQTPSYPLDLGGPGKCIQRKKPMVSKKLKSQDPCFVFLHALTIPFPGLHSWTEFPHLSMVALTHHLSAREVEAGCAGVQSQPWIQNKLEASPGHMKPWFQNESLLKDNSQNMPTLCFRWVVFFVLFCYRLFPHFIDKRRSPLWNRLLPVFG